MEGWVKIHRIITENPLYFSEPFTRCQAWIDLLIIANNKDGTFFKRGVRVDVKRGQVGYDIDTLAKRWKWSRGKVERYFVMLEIDKQIVRQKNNVTTLISIVNYDLYQASDKANDKPSSKPSSKANGHQTDTNKKDKEEEERKEEYIKNEFEKFRLLYGGKKRGLETELEHFKKKYSNYEEILPLLYPAVERLIAWRKRKKELSQWIPEYPNMQTWINQKRWEEEFETTKEVKQSPKLNYV